MGLNKLIVFVSLILLLCILNNQQHAVNATTTTFNETQSFFEELVIKPLPKGKLMTHVQFTTEWNSNFLDQSTFQHYDLFPRSIGDLITRVGIEELTLVFTQGRWSYSEWGYPVRAAPVGVELIAWMKPLEKGIDAQWRELTNSLSGLFCASMQFLYQVPHHTSSPNRSFRPEGSSNIYQQNNEYQFEDQFERDSNSRPAIEITHGSDSNNKTTVPLELRYGILPRESVCTENLTPWVKLLPCREQSGLGKLLNPNKLYDVHYHSMSITIRKICKHQSCLAPTLEIVQTLTIVNDLNNQQQQQQDHIDINLDSLFGIKSNSDQGNNGGLSACPLATRSKVYIQKQSNLNLDLKLTPQPKQHDNGSEEETKKKEEEKEESRFYTYDLMKYSTSKPLKLKMNWIKNFKSSGNSGSSSSSSSSSSSGCSTPVIAHSHLTGYGQERGGIATQIFNNENYAINITYFQAIPWYLRLYFHTLNFNVDGEEYQDEDFLYKNISPAETRSSPSTIELSFEMPPNSVASMSIDFDKVFLHYTEHPPDANRGFDLGSGVVTAYISPHGSSCSLQNDTIDIEWSSETYGGTHSKQQTTTNNNNNNNNNNKMIIPVRIYTEGLLITLPTPDFSMLYNVITLTGTVFALFFGSMINILIRRFKNTFTGNDFVSDRPIAKIYRRILRFIDGKN